MKYFMDTEFYEFDPSDSRPLWGANAVQLISIAIVGEDGREFYAENRDFDWDRVPADHWIQTNVRPHLFGDSRTSFHPHERHYWKSRFERGQSGGYGDTGTIAAQVRRFVEHSKRTPSFYGWFCDYDWVVFCGLFGRMVDLPSGWPMYMNDLKQTSDMLGDPALARQGYGKDDLPPHHALADARDIRMKYFALQHHLDSRRILL